VCSGERIYRHFLCYVTLSGSGAISGQELVQLFFYAACMWCAWEDCPVTY